MRWVLAALATAIGVGGSAFAIILLLNAYDAKSELTAARAALSRTKAELSLLCDEVVGAHRQVEVSHIPAELFSHLAGRV